MTDVLAQVLSDLAAEGDRLEALVIDLDGAGWRTPTPAAGWDVAAQVAHLAWTDEVALKAATDKDAWLNEGTTTYVQSRITEALYGKPAAA